MARGILKLCGAAFIFVAGWKAQEKTHDIFCAPKPATVLEKLSQFWDDISADSATEKQEPPLMAEQAEKLLRRRQADQINAEKLPRRGEADQIKPEQEKDIWRRLTGSLTEQVKRPRDGNDRSRPPSSRSS